MKVGHSAHFEKAEFHGAADFGSAQIGSYFLAQGAKFLNETAEAVFNNMKVDKTGMFDEATFNGPVHLRYAIFQTIEFQNVNYANVNSEGMIYKNIICNDWKKFLEKSPYYHAQPYTQLVAFYQQNGNTDLADQVFIIMKNRELAQSSWLRRWLIKIFWGWLAGFGRKPWQVLYAIVLMVVLGALLLFTGFDDEVLTLVRVVAADESKPPLDHKILDKPGPVSARG